MHPASVVLMIGRGCEGLLLPARFNRIARVPIIQNGQWPYCIRRRGLDLGGQIFLKRRRVVYHGQRALLDRCASGQRRCCGQGDDHPHGSGFPSMMIAFFHRGTRGSTLGFLVSMMPFGGEEETPLMMIGMLGVSVI